MGHEFFFIATMLAFGLLSVVSSTRAARWASEVPCLAPAASIDDGLGGRLTLCADKINASTAGFVLGAGAKFLPWGIRRY